MPLSNVDLLTEDRPLANQKFACISFVSPETILKQKEHYFFEKFVKQWEFKKATEKYTQFMHFLAYKYPLIWCQYIRQSFFWVTLIWTFSKYIESNHSVKDKMH